MQVKRCCTRLFIVATALLVSGACNRSAAPGAPKAEAPTQGGRVLVVANERSQDGLDIASYYMRQREVPATNLVTVDVPVDDEIGEIDFIRRIQSPIRAAIDRLPQRIDFIVLTKGIPLRLQNKRGYSVDAHVAGMRLSIPPMVGYDSLWLTRYRNPYFAATEPFNSERYNMYLVTRLDCRDTDDCFALIDRSLAARPVRGPFFFDAMRPVRNQEPDGYGYMDLSLHRAYRRLKTIGADVFIDSSSTFVAPGFPLAGYASWGSNDSRFDEGAWHRLRFLPGAIAETFVSTSARTFRPVTEGQSVISDLIAQGVTGVKGYVSEPYTTALADPEILFDRYVHGFTLAESFYAASRMVLWKDVVVGDPLCAPYGQFSVSPGGKAESR